MNNSRLIIEMIAYYTGDVKRINHFLKVHAYAKAIGEMEGIESNKQEILEVAALVHDIGIRISEEKYHSSAGKYQELEGPSIARDLLLKLNYPVDLIDRVCFLIANHHTYHQIDGIDFQILVEADFLVNIHEEEIQEREVLTIKERIFKTRTGFIFLNHLFGV